MHPYYLSYNCKFVSFDCLHPVPRPRHTASDNHKFVLLFYEFVCMYVWFWNLINSILFFYEFVCIFVQFVFFLYGFYVSLIVLYNTMIIFYTLCLISNTHFCIFENNHCDKPSYVTTKILPSHWLCSLAVRFILVHLLLLNESFYILIFLTNFFLPRPRFPW